MARLRRPFGYATSGNYPGSIGTTSWSGLARRYSPTDAELADGDTPDTPIAVQKINYLIALQGDALTVQDHAALTNWGHFTSPPAIATRFLIPIPATNGAGGVLANRPSTFVLSGIAGGTSQENVISQDLKSFEASAVLSGFGPFATLASNDAGLLFGGLSSTVCKYSADQGATFTNFTPGIGVQPTAVYYTGSTHIIAGTGAVAFGDPVANTWTASTFGFAVESAVQIIGNRNNGSVATILVMLTLNGVTGDRATKYSTDNGATWIAAHTFVGVQANLTYSTAWGLFVVLTTSGELWTSPDGATWTKQKTAASLSLVPGYAKSAALGDAICCIVNRTTGTGVNNNIGIAYTFDLGATWYESYFGDITNASSLRVLIAANGRLYASDDTRVYISGALESPPTANYLGV